MHAISIHTDGGSRGNPGPAALGVVIEAPINKGYSHFLGKATNNEAEYQAVIFALEKLRATLGKDKIKNIHAQFFMDSQLAVNQLSGAWKVEGPTIVPLFMKIWNLRIEFGEVSFQHIPREQNEDADKLVNQELDKHTFSDSLFNL